MARLKPHLTPPPLPNRNALRRGWTLIKDLLQLVEQRNLGLVAAGVAFYAMLAVFPAITAVVSVWSWLADPVALQYYIDVAAEFMPADALGLLQGQVDSLLNSATGGIGWRTLMSLMVALWSARAGLAAVVRGINAIHAYPSRQGLWQMAVALMLTVAIVGMAIVALATVVVLPIILRFLPLGPVSGWLIGGLPWLATFFLLIGTLSLIYRFGPNTRRARRSPWFTPGAFAAALLWALASVGFSIYLANFANYNRVYGSLGAGIALLMWFFLSAYAVLLGAALNQALGIPAPKADDEREELTDPV